MNVLRWAGGLSALIGIAVGGLLLTTFLGLSKCPISKVLFSDANSSCSSQRLFFYLFGGAIVVGLFLGYGIVSIRSERMQRFFSIGGLLYGLGLVWFLFFGMSGMFGGGLH